MEYENILFEQTEGVAVITLNRPNALNALNTPHLAELNAAVDRCNYDPAIRSVVITGAGRGFSAGADTRSWADGSDDSEPGFGWGDYAHALMSKVYRLPKPVIAAVNGVAVGAGCDLTLACDMRIGSTAARFGQAYINIGYCPDAGGSYFLPRIVGEARAMEMIYTGRIVDAEEAHRIGLLLDLVEPDELMPKAMELAGRLAKGPAIAIALAKENIRANAEVSLEEALRREHRGGEICAKTEDHKEGLAATNERRPANFVGR